MEFAYRTGCVELQLQNIPEHLTPILYKRQHGDVERNQAPQPTQSAAKHEIDFASLDLKQLTKEQKLAIVSRLDERAIPPYVIDPFLVNAFVAALSAPPEAHALINRANFLRQKADPDLEPQSIVMPLHALPPIGEHGITDMQTFWMSVINKACARGAKMLGSVLLETPSQVTGSPGDDIHNEILRILRSYYR
jgi:hypothetical protein